MEEQPAVIASILEQEKAILAQLPVHIKQRKQIILSASGSSLNAAFILKPFFKQLDILIETPFDLRYNSTLLCREAEDKVLIVISQTGKSVGTLACIQKAKEHGITTIALTAANQSPIAIAADYHIDILCGEEPVGPKTKGFSASVIMLHLLLMHLSSDIRHAEVVSAYTHSANDIKDTMQRAIYFGEQHQDWAKADGFSVVGYGMNHGSAREGSLKLLETMQIPVMNYDMEEFMHGPHRTITSKTHLILIQHGQEGSELMHNLIQFARSKTDHVLVLTTDATQRSDEIQLPTCEVLSSWLHAVVIFQVLCTLFPEYNGINSADPVYGDFATSVGTRIA